MTAAEKAGQVILARYPGENALSEAQKYNLGGYVMFGVDFRGSTPEEITAKIAEIQSLFQNSAVPRRGRGGRHGGAYLKVPAVPCGAVPGTG